MNPQASAKFPNGFLCIHAVPFQQGGFYFVRSPEMNLVARGRSEFEAVVNLVNMATASIAVAVLRGNLSTLIERTGVEIVETLPPEQASATQERNIFIPILAASDARARSVG
jgi:hypothetical protein